MTHALPSRVDVAIIGAGFCGLSAAAALETYGVPRIAIFEAGAGPGHFWTGNYDRIHLHSPWHDLPADGGLGTRYPMYKAGAQVVHYLDAYAAHHGLMPLIHAQTPVTQICREGSPSHPWRIVSPHGECIARHAIVATSSSRVPWRPTIDDPDAFDGLAIHSREYRNPGPFEGKMVVVVGSGNSAAEIALDLAQGGASAVTLLVKGPRYFLKLGSLSRLAKVAKVLGLAGPKRLRQIHPITSGSDEFWAKIRSLDRMMRLFCQDLSSFGIHRPTRGLNEEAVTTGRIGVMDVGAVDAIRGGTIEVHRGHVTAFTPRGVALDSGGELAADAVILATGYRHRLQDFVADSEQLLGPRLERPEPMPLTDNRCRSRVHPDLWFIGWDLGLLGGLHWGLWGWEVGEKIASELGTFRPGLRPPEIGAPPWR